MSSDSVMDLIAAQDWLDSLSDPAQEAIKALFPGELGAWMKDAIHGKWLGHPLHPVLTDIPLGAWTVAAVLDAAEAVTGSESLGAAADACVAVGLVGAFGAAITGATDWTETGGRAKRLGLTHGILNIAATALYGTSLAMRLAGSRRAGVALSLAGFALSGSSAYIGGHLVFGEQIGVDHTATANAEEPAEFTALFKLDDLTEDEPVRAVADGVAILLVKRGSQVFAITEICPHQGGPLSEGKLRGNAIECPWHGSQLDLADGHIVCGPTTYPARTFDVRIRSGQVEVRAQRL
jgi:nitrite reductase/ring-hydroxylating ferredoxin subunit/uncharacterized membrane protein